MQSGGYCITNCTFPHHPQTPPKPPDRQMEPAAPHSAAVTMASWCPRGWGYLGIGNHSVLAMSVRSGDG